MKIKRLLLVLFCAVSTLCAQGGAPMITDDTGTPGDGKWEINIATTMELGDKNRHFEAPLIDINYGYGHNIQLKLESVYAFDKKETGDSQKGLGNAVVGIKWQFFDKDGLSLSTYPRYTFTPLDKSPDKGTVENERSLFLPVEITKELDGSGISAEFGYKFSKVRGGKDKIVYGFVYGYEVTKLVELLAEYRVECDVNWKEPVKIVQLGVKVELNKNYYLVGAIGKEIDSPENKKARLGFLGVQMKF